MFRGWGLLTQPTRTSCACDEPLNSSVPRHVRCVRIDSTVCLTRNRATTRKRNRHPRICTLRHDVLNRRRPFSHESHRYLVRDQMSVGGQREVFSVGGLVGNFSYPVEGCCC